MSESRNHEKLFQKDLNYNVMKQFFLSVLMSMVALTATADYTHLLEDGKVCHEIAFQSQDAMEGLIDTIEAATSNANNLQRQCLIVDNVLGTLSQMVSGVEATIHELLAMTAGVDATQDADIAQIWLNLTETEASLQGIGQSITELKARNGSIQQEIASSLTLLASLEDVDFGAATAEEMETYLKTVEDTYKEVENLNFLVEALFNDCESVQEKAKSMEYVTDLQSYLKKRYDSLAHTMTTLYQACLDMGANVSLKVPDGTFLSVYQAIDYYEEVLSGTLAINDVNGVATTAGNTGRIDLQGHRVTGSPRPGIYIQRGRKLTVKGI
jgi:hypothetical protein